MSNKLLARQNPVFESGAKTIVGFPAGSCVLDLRLHWPRSAATKESPTPLLESASMSGKSIVTDVSYTAGENFSISFAAKHPLEDVYYSASIECDRYGYAQARYITANKIYNVQGGIYYVAEGDGSSSIHSEVSWSGGYILIDLNAPGPQPSVGTVIEPFNVVFEPINVLSNGPYIEDTSMIGSIVKRGNRIIEEGTIFTNSPVVDGKAVTPHYNFNIVGNAIQFSLNSAVSTEHSPGIKSINGVLPDNGNINIQVLK